MEKNSNSDVIKIKDVTKPSVLTQIALIVTIASGICLILGISVVGIIQYIIEMTKPPVIPFETQTAVVTETETSTTPLETTTVLEEKSTTSVTQKSEPTTQRPHYTEPVTERSTPVTNDSAKDNTENSNNTTKEDNNNDSYTLTPEENGKDSEDFRNMRNIENSTIAETTTENRNTEDADNNSYRSSIKTNVVISNSVITESENSTEIRFDNNGVVVSIKCNNGEYYIDEKVVSKDDFEEFLQEHKYICEILKNIEAFSDIDLKGILDSIDNR